MIWWCWNWQHLEFLSFYSLSKSSLLAYPFGRCRQVPRIFSKFVYLAPASRPRVSQCYMTADQVLWFWSKCVRSFSVTAWTVDADSKRTVVGIFFISCSVTDKLKVASGYELRKWWLGWNSSYLGMVTCSMKWMPRILWRHHWLRASSLRSRSAVKFHVSALYSNTGRI